MDGLQVVGRSVRRTDAAEKLTGRATFTTDIALPGMLHAKLLRSPHAHALIRRVDASRARAAPGVHAVLTRDEVPPGLMAVYGYFIKDQPIVATDRVRHVGDVVAAVAAETEAQAVHALSLIAVEYESLPVAASIEAALAADAPELFPEAPVGVVPAYGEGARGALRPARNVCFEFGYRMGDHSAFAGCDHVFADEFRFSRMWHFHLEPFVSVAHARPDGIEIWSSNQNPFPLRKEIARIFRVPENAITIRVPFVGGGFGSKNNCKTEPAAVLLSMLSGRPVRLALTMEEGFLTNTQHAAILRLRTGVMADGRLVARQSEVLLDAGAYSDASPLVAEKAGYRVAGPYRWQHVDSLCRCVMTNTAPAGPFRGFGGTQANWASESQVDMIARRLGLDPFEMRRRNLIALHEPFMPGESGVDSDLLEGLEVVVRELHRPAREDGRRRGVGFAVGFKDGGGVNKPAQARVKVSTSGDIYLGCGTIEIGQGARTALPQVVAEILGAPAHRVRALPVDTDHTPFDQGTNASSGIAVMGQAVQRAATAVRDQVLAFAAGQLGCDAAELRLEDWHILRGNERLPLAPMVMRHFGGTGFEFTADGFFKPEADHHAPLEARCVYWEIGWAAAQVAVDEGTGQVTVEQLVVAGDAGRAINPLLCKGQDEGSAVMGFGQAMFETMRFDAQGNLLNGEPLLYRVPLAEDLPGRLVAITLEQGHGPGPFGAKGLGEGAMLPVAPAIANAVQDATGARVTELPISPERVLRALDAAKTTPGHDAIQPERTPA
ncbi:MAG: xanthine dehydrogenase family protein molybdopterin-binding subunit [Acetobacteraceae bacterium]|nr:xanthine dehydrogenase family protein molybdopterin-binding subunit [Acetobacteraceae bacterium]